MNLDPRHLVQLAAIVETGSFHAAAKQLGLTQPAISRNIKTLETRLGETLFDRGSRSAKVTVLGLKLARQGMVIQSASAAAGHYADLSYSGETGTLLIGAPPTLASGMLAKMFGQFLTEHEEINAELRVGLIHELRSLLVQGRINLIVGPVSLADQADNLVAHDLIEDRVGILCRAGHPLTKVSQITAQTLESQRWAAHSQGSFLRFQTDQALATFGVRELNIAIETDSVEVAFDIARQSEIVTTMPMLPSKSQMQAGDLVFLEIDSPLFKRTIGYIQRNSNDLSRAENRFIEFVKNELTIM